MSAPLPPCDAERMTQRKSATAQERLHDQRHRPESRKFPAATFVGKKPALRAVHHVNRAQNKRYERECHETRGYTKNEQRAAAEFGRHCQVSDKTRQA